MGDGVHLDGAGQLDNIGAALKEAADKDLTNNVRRSMRDVVKPVGDAVLTAGADKMPKRGGFASKVRSQGKVGATSALASRTLHVTLTLSNRGANLRSLDAGILRHPVFARADRKRTWVRQSVPAKAFSTAFYAQAPLIQRQTLDAMQTTLDNVGRKF